MKPTDLPAALQGIALRHLFTLEVEVDTLQGIGGSPDIKRRVGPISRGGLAATSPERWTRSVSGMLRARSRKSVR